MQQTPCCAHTHSAFMLRVRQFSKLASKLSSTRLKQASFEKSRRHRSAAALVTKESETAAPTFVPRTPGVTDGKWDQQDEEAVKVALMDAEKVVKKRSSAQPGMLPTSLFITLQLEARQVTNSLHLLSPSSQANCCFPALITLVLHSAASTMATMMRSLYPSCLYVHSDQRSSNNGSKDTCMCCSQCVAGPKH